MSPELRRLRTALIIFIMVWLAQALLVQAILYGRGRRVEGLETRLQQVEAKIESFGQSAPPRP